MDIKKIAMPDGRLRTYYKGDHQTWAEIVQNVIIPDGEAYCESNWISVNHESKWSPENRVKSFLDRCAYLMSLDNPSGLESAYKAMSHKVREIPASECPTAVSDLFYSDRVPANDFDEDDRFKSLMDRLDEVDPRKKKKPIQKKRQETRFDRISKIRNTFPMATLSWVYVDGANKFTYSGKEYKISDSIKGYSQTDKLDSMDRILVVDNCGSLLFYDQNANPLA